MKTWVVVVWTIANIPLFALIGWVLFGSVSQLGDDVQQAAGPLSQYTVEGRFSEYKLLFFLISCAALMAAEYKLFWG